MIDVANYREMLKEFNDCIYRKLESNNYKVSITIYDDNITFILKVPYGGDNYKVVTNRVDYSNFIQIYTFFSIPKEVADMMIQELQRDNLKMGGWRLI